MSTEKMLNEYATMKDSSADADYEPQSEEASSEETSSEGDLDTEEEKTESQRKLNRELHPRRWSFRTSKLQDVEALRP